MAIKTSQLIVSLRDRVSKQARAISGAMATLNASSAKARMQAQAMHGQMLGVAATGYT